MFYGAILLPSKNCPINIPVRLIEFNWNSNYKHLKLQISYFRPVGTVRQHWDCITLKMRTPQNYVKNADTTEAYFNKSHLLRRVRFN